MFFIGISTTYSGPAEPTTRPHPAPNSYIKKDKTEAPALSRGQGPAAAAPFLEVHAEGLGEEKEAPFCPMVMKTCCTHMQESEKKTERWRGLEQPKPVWRGPCHHGTGTAEGSTAKRSLRQSSCWCEVCGSGSPAPASFVSAFHTLPLRRTQRARWLIGKAGSPEHKG